MENKFIGILFECCNIYRRIYVNKEKNAYEGKCPKCNGEVKVKIGPGGTETRFFFSAIDFSCDYSSVVFLPSFFWCSFEKI